MKYFPLRSISVTLVISRIWKSFSVDPPPEAGHRNGKSWQCFGRAGLLKGLACGLRGLGAGTGGCPWGRVAARPRNSGDGTRRSSFRLTSWCVSTEQPGLLMDGCIVPFPIPEFWVTNPSLSCSQHEGLRANASHWVRAPSWCWAWSSVVTLTYKGS